MHSSSLSQLLGRDAVLLTASFVLAQILYVSGLVCVARWVPPEELGTYALFISFCAFFTVTGAWALENAFFVCQPGQDRRSVWGAAQLVCVANSLAAVLIFWGFMALWVDVPASVLGLIPVYVFAQCQVSVLLADHFSRRSTRVIARNRIFRALLTVSIWMACVAFHVGRMDTMLILAVVIGALVSMCRLYKSSSCKGETRKSTLAECFKALQIYRRYPLAEGPALFINALSGHGIILLTGLFFDLEIAGLVGMAVLAVTKPAGLIAQSIGRMAQADFARAIRCKDFEGARQVLARTLVVLCILAFGGVAIVLMLAAYVVPRVLNASWAGLADLLIIFTPVLVIMIFSRPLTLFLSVTSKQKIIFAQELTVSICPLIGFGLAFGLSGVWSTTLITYISTLILLYVAFFPIVIYALCSIGSEQVRHNALRERP